MNNFLFIEDPRTKEKRINVVAVALLATLTLPLIYAAKRIVSKVLNSRAPVKQLEDVTPPAIVTGPVAAKPAQTTAKPVNNKISPALSDKAAILENILAKRPTSLDTTKFVAKDTNAAETTVVDVKAKSNEFAALFAKIKAPTPRTETTESDTTVKTAAPAIPPRPINANMLNGAKLKTATPVAKDAPAPRSTATTGAAPSLAELAVAQRAKLKPATPVAKDAPAPIGTATTGAALSIAEQAMAKRKQMLSKKETKMKV